MAAQQGAKSSSGVEGNRASQQDIPYSWPYLKKKKVCNCWLQEFIRGDLFIIFRIFILLDASVSDRCTVHDNDQVQAGHRDIKDSGRINYRTLTKLCRSFIRRVLPAASLLSEPVHGG